MPGKFRRRKISGAGPGSIPFEDEHVDDVIAALQKEDAVPYNHTHDVVRQSGQPVIACDRQCAPSPGKARRQAPAARQFLLNAGRQAFEIIAGEAAVQDFTVAIAEEVHFLNPYRPSFMFMMSPVVAPFMMIVVIVIIIIVVMSPPGIDIFFMTTGPVVGVGRFA